MENLIVTGPLDIIDNRTVYAFDLDHTLIKPRASIHPKDENDWVWIPGAKEKLIALRDQALVIFTNQATAGLTVERKMQHIFADLGFGILTFIATDIEYRKPSPKMFEKYKYEYAPAIETGFFIGDAAGREGDHDDTDLKFALNCGLEFITNTDWLASTRTYIAPAIYRGWEQLQQLRVDPGYYKFEESDNEMVLLVGPPACGKTSFAKMYYPSYAVINQDTVNKGKPGTRAQCLKLARLLSICHPRRVIVDSTTADAKRDEFITIARENNMRVKIYHFAYPLEFCKYLNGLRAYMGGKSVPAIAYNVYKKNMILPREYTPIDKFPYDDKKIPEDVARLLF